MDTSAKLTGPQWTNPKATTTTTTMDRKNDEQEFEKFMFVFCLWPCDCCLFLDLVSLTGWFDKAQSG
jgi:hypothetical protein